MSGGDDESPVEQEYHREEHHEQKAMDSKQTGAKLRSNILTRSFDDDRSVGSAKSGNPLLAQLFFQNATVKVADPIGEDSLPATIHSVTSPGLSGDQNSMPTTTSCRTMRNTTSNVLTRSFTTKMLPSTSLDIYSSSTKVPMQMTTFNRLTTTIDRSMLMVSGQLVIKSATTPKTNWCDGSTDRSVKTKKQAPQQQMTVTTAPPRPVGGCGGSPPPAVVPIVTAVIVS